jgi:hypothetical protein
MQRFKKDLMAGALAVLLLGAIGAARWFGPSAADAEPYHARVRVAVEAMPMRVGTWVGEDEPLIAAAIDMLHPNVAIHRVYRDIQTGHTASLLFVQCKDARDLAGHFPPICYPGQGWQLDHQAATRWDCGPLKIDGTEYAFSYGGVAGANRILVANFMLLPDGTIAADMDAVRRIASDYKRRFFGAAQVQIVTDARIPAQQRERMVRDLLEANAPLFQLILLGEQS